MGAMEGLAAASGTLSVLGLVLGGLEMWQYKSTTDSACNEPLRTFFLVDAIVQFITGAIGLCNVCLAVTSLDKEQMKYQIRKKKAQDQGQPFQEDPGMEQRVQEASVKQSLRSTGSQCIMGLLGCVSLAFLILGWNWYSGTDDQSCLPSMRHWTFGILIYKITSLCCAPCLAMCVVLPCMLMCGIGGALRADDVARE